MAFTNLIDWLTYPGLAKAKHYHRQLLLYPADASGEVPVNTLLNALPVTLNIATVGCSVSPRQQAITPVTQCELSHYRTILGQEFDIGIYNAHQGFQPNALLALAGTLRHAGRLIILCPPLDQWPTHSSVTRPRFLSYGWTLRKSYFIQQFITQLTSDSSVALYEPELQRLPLLSVDHNDKAKPDNAIFATRCQEDAYTGIIDNINAYRPLCVLTSPRGRGKSALIGIISAALLQEGKKLHLISALHQSQTVFYRHLAQRMTISIEDARALVQWIPPDHPDVICNTADVMIVDEAAALPLPVLLRIIDNNAQCLLTTTTLGFEGSGLGFLHKFLAPRRGSDSLAHYSLKEPVRWACNDPLEKIFDHCLLFAPSALPALPCGTTVSFELTRAGQLSFEKLATVFQLLHESHYQTSPDDLMRLTDAPDIVFVLAKRNEHLIGAAIINIEGGHRLSALSADIAAGMRRIKGHLSAQSIALLSASPEFANHSYWRINRIAVHQTLRRQKIGRDMVRFIAERACKENVDWLSSSYGATDSVNRFWETCGFSIVREGKKQDKASGQVSNLVVRPLSHNAISRVDLLHGLFLFDKADSNGELHQCVKNYALHSTITNRTAAYLNGARARHQTGNALHYAISRYSQQFKETHPILFAIYIEGVSAKGAIEAFHLTGKKDLEQKIRKEAIRLLQRS